MISKTSEYAIRAVLHIAQHADDGPVPANAIAEAVDVPPNYLSKILHTLARSGILDSERGPRGGFQLARPADQVPVAAVIEPFDALGERRYCLLGQAECSDRSACTVHDRWKRAYEPVLRFFNDTTLSDLLEGAPRAGATTGG